MLRSTSPCGVVPGTLDSTDNTLIDGPSSVSNTAHRYSVHDQVLRHGVQQFAQNVLHKWKLCLCNDAGVSASTETVFVGLDINVKLLGRVWSGPPYGELLADPTPNSLWRLWPLMCSRYFRIQSPVSHTQVQLVPTRVATRRIRQDTTVMVKM